MKPLRLISVLYLAVLAAAVISGCSAATPPTGETDGSNPPSGEISISAERIRGLGLEGTLVLIRFVNGTPALFSLDLQTAEFAPLFAPPRGAWITAASASAAAGKIAMAYSPAPAEGQSQRGFTGISLLPLDGGGQPEEFIRAVEEEALFSFPEWTPDGSALYFNRFQFSSEASGVYTPVIGRQPYPEGDEADLVEFGQWPRLSWDGRLMVYIGIASGESEGASELLEVLNLAEEGAAPVSVPVGPEVEVLDVPMFSPDGEMIYFSAPASPAEEPQSGLSMAADWLGFSAARAHDVPSDWWRVPVGGGPAARLTTVGDTGMYGEFSPDGRHLAYISNRGVFVMEPDGSNLLPLIEAEGFFGTIDWVAAGQQ
ncbi:MAG: hypothetical protein R3335_02715 [Anaerolineales bacterium]|nr:hypothetical protein [Anaerolineales bacterium]